MQSVHVARSIRNRQIVRSGVIGFAIGLGTIGVVAQGSPANHLAAAALHELTGQRQHRTITVLVPADGASAAPAATPTPSTSGNQDYVAPLAQPQDNYVAPQQSDPYVQPAPAQTPQSQAS